MHCNPEPQHQWLKKLIGTWEFESNCSMGPDQPQAKSTGREVVRALGDLWIVAEGGGEMPGGVGGGQMSYIMILGYDPQKKKYVGSWVGSPMTTHFVYEGEMDGAGQVLPLNTTGPSFTDPAKTSRYQDVMELKPDGSRLLRSQMLGDDGQWTQFMQATYKRVG